MTLFAELAELSQRVAATRARTAKVRELARALCALDPEEIAIAVQYLAGELPQGRIGISHAVLREAAQTASAPEPSLTIIELDRKLTQIAALRGEGSAGLRLQALRELFARCTQLEQAFFVRLIVGELRQGALAGVMLDAIAAAADVPIEHVRRAAMYAENLGVLAHTALTQGASALAEFQIVLFAPVAPMLAQTATDVGEALERLGGAAQLEWKMDGARIQVHKSGEAVRVYTRNGNDVTAAVPEIVAAVRALPVHSAILDGEAIAVTPTGRPHPFQTTMRRFGRKLDVPRLQAELPMQAYFFDCLLHEADSLVDRPLQERMETLARLVPETMRMPRLVTRSTDAAREFYEASLAAGHEGLMAKALHAPYEAGNRGASWLKIKRTHTLDLVVLAAEWGHGRRTGKLSNLHLGARYPATGEYVMLGKTFKGLTDALLAWQTEELLRRETHRDGYTVYVRPELVVEIAFSDLQVSPRYPGGLALRLARVKRYRLDKSAEEADTIEQVRQIAGL